MKKLALLFAIIFISTSQVFAQETDSFLDQGLSESKCRWMRVQLNAIEVKRGSDQVYTEVWKECVKGSANCVDKFCTGVPTTFADIEKTVGWDKGSCNKYCITLQEQLPIEGSKVQSISGDSGVDLLRSYFGMWYKFGALVLGLIAVLVIVISGVQIIAGGASEEGVSSAKTRIMAAILSLILLFSSALILRTINPLFFT